MQSIHHLIGRLNESLDMIGRFAVAMRKLHMPVLK